MATARSQNVAALLVLAALPGCREGAREEPRFENEDVRLELGLGGVRDGGRWNLLRIRVTNRGADFLGALEARGVMSDPLDTSEEPDVAPVTYRQRLEVPRGETREVAFLVRPEAWQGPWQGIEAALRGSGYERKFRLPLSPATAARFRLLVAAESGPDLGNLIRTIEGSFEKPAGREALPGEWRCETAVVVPADLPSVAAALHPFQLVILHGTNLAGARPEAIQALRDWVSWGGTLVVFPGPGWASGLPPEVGALLGVTLGDPAAPMPAALAAAVGPGAGEGHYRQILPASAGDATETAPQPGSAPPADSASAGLAITSRLGAGSVTTFSFAPGGRRFPALDEVPGIYRALNAPYARAVSFAGNPLAGIAEVERAADAALGAMAPIAIPTPGLMAAGLIAYILVGFVLPALIFRRLGRREWTFAWAVATAAMATFGIHRYGLLSFGRESEVEEITLLRLHAGGGAAEATSFLGLYSPARQTVALPADGAGRAGSLPQPLRTSTELYSFGRRRALFHGGLATLESEGSGRLRLEPQVLLPNSLTCFRFDYRLPAQEIVALRSAADAGGAPGPATIVNRTSAPLFSFHISGKAVSPGGEIPAGGTASLPNDATPASPTFWTKIQGIVRRQPEPIIDALRRGSLDREGPWADLDGVLPALLAAIGGLVKEVEGLPDLEWYRWGALPPPDEAAGRGPVSEVVRRAAPRFLLLVARTPVFPAAPPGFARKAITMIIIELPRRGDA